MKLGYEKGLPLTEILVLGSRASIKFKGYLDTGASWVSVKPEAIQRLELEYLGEMPLYTAAGFLVVELYLARVLFLGREFRTPVFPLDIPKEHDFDCLIGMSVLRHFKITFDNRNQVLEIE